jgi:rRNA small subunit pseudouridine methyltransferase Nep1
LFDSNLELFNNELLDVSKHFRKMRRDDLGKRGRPDITHVGILNVCDFPAYSRGEVGLILHTIDNKVILIKDSWRPPRNYINFSSLFAQLLKLGRVPPEGEPLLLVSNSALKDTLSDLRVKKVILLSSRGKKVNLEQYLTSLRSNIPVAFLVGAYARGAPRDEILAISDEVISVYDKVLTTNVVLSMLMCYLEKVFL